MEVEKYSMVYQYKKNMNLKIFGKIFVQNNRNKAKVILKNKNIKLAEIIPKEKIKGNKSKEIKVKVILKKNHYDKSFMFNDCKSLKKFSFEEDIINEENICEIKYFSKNECQNQDGEYSNKDTDEYELNISTIHTIEEKKNNDTLKNIKNNLTINNNYANMQGMFSNCSSLI